MRLYIVPKDVVNKSKLKNTIFSVGFGLRRVSRMANFSFWQKCYGVPFYKRHSATYLYLVLVLSYPVSGIYNFVDEYGLGPFEQFVGVILVGCSILTGTLVMCFFSTRFNHLSRIDNFIKVHNIKDNEGNVDPDEWGGFSPSRGITTLIVLGIFGFSVLLVSGFLGQILRGVWGYLSSGI